MASQILNKFQPYSIYELTEWTVNELKQVSDELEHSTPELVLRWGFENFAPDIVLATGFGPEGVVLMHMASEIRPETKVFYLDTALLFPETYALRDELVNRLGIRFERIPSSISLADQAVRYGDALWKSDPDSCCYLRKVIPQREYLSGYRAWITGIRRDQTIFRADAGLVEWDNTNKMVKFNPLAAWNKDQVWEYIREHNLPYNALHDKDFPSIGCMPCTRAVTVGEDPRAGRWSGTQKTECGIHLKMNNYPDQQKH
jgi:phosphoadenosine phosphosulfate reductase